MDKTIIEEKVEEQYVPQPISCKFCGKSPLKWHLKRNGKWILTSLKGTPHKCKFGFSKVTK